MISPGYLTRHYRRSDRQQAFLGQYQHPHRGNQKDRWSERVALIISLAPVELS